MTSKKDETKEAVVKNPVEWLFHAALMVLGAVIALTFALQLLASIWMWLVGIGLLIGGAVVAIRVAASRRRNW